MPGRWSGRCATDATFRIAGLARVGLHHLDLVVSSLERSLPLYRELLGPLGYLYSAEIEGERGERVVYLDGEGVGASISLREAHSPTGAYDRYAVGLHHIAFEAASREMVDERLAWAKDKGLEIENEPQEWPYVPGYYAGFFHDPDGIKLEVVYVPERSEMSTTPPPDQPGTTTSAPPTTSGPTGTTGTSGTPWLGSIPDAARLPIPGNAEFALYLVSLVLAWLVCWFTDSLNANNWFTFFTVITAIYILSRGIAKASRVLEQ